MKLNNLPKEIADYIKDYSIEENHIGFSDSKVYHLVNMNNKNSKNLYLKMITNNNHNSKISNNTNFVNQIHNSISDNANLFYEKKELKYEKKLLDWLKEKIPVPQVMYYHSDKYSLFLITSEIKGIGAEKLINKDNIPELVKMLARGLKNIHSLDITNCEFNKCNRIMIDEAKERVDNNIVIEEYFEEQYSNKNSKELYSLLIEKYKQIDNEDLVFAHGDYCLPNIIINNNKISGFIDWGRGGISDRYRDMAIASRSIEYNCGKGWTELFYNEYGIHNIDWKKHEFYILLDEFF